MPDDYYPTPDPDDAASPSHGDPENEMDKKGEDDAKMEGETALLPNSILGGKEFKPGDELTLKIVKMHGDEVEVSYSAKDSNSNTDEDGPEMAHSMQGMDKMGM